MHLVCNVLVCLCQQATGAWSQALALARPQPPRSLGMRLAAALHLQVVHCGGADVVQDERGADDTRHAGDEAAPEVEHAALPVDSAEGVLHGHVLGLGVHEGLHARLGRVERVRRGRAKRAARQPRHHQRRGGRVARVLHGGLEHGEQPQVACRVQPLAPDGARQAPVDGGQLVGGEERLGLHAQRAPAPLLLDDDELRGRRDERGRRARHARRRERL
mmetsp:Transcript_23803/g.60701  ORF Transcript_23803/g.60701 Transcript_23803/m.60701 type:complete len:218 (+) Transcript_23803:711-1364(+)